MFKKGSKHSFNLLASILKKWQKIFQAFFFPLPFFFYSDREWSTHAFRVFVFEGFFSSNSFLNWRKGRETWHFYKNSEFVFVILQKSKLKYRKVRILQMNRVTAASSSLVTTNHNSVLIYKHEFSWSKN